MNWLNLRTETLHAPQYIGSDPTRRATWISLMLWCAQQENGGIVSGGANWSDRQWQQTCGVTKDEATDSCDLFRVDGADVVLWGYNVEKEAEVQERREWARENGRKGGRPRKSASEEPTPVSENNQHRYQHPKAEGEGEGEGERKENENRNEKKKEVQEETAGPASPPASVAVEPLALTSEPPAKPAKSKRTPKQPAQTDAEWLASLAASPAYVGLDVPREHAKASEWCRVRQQTLSRQRFVNWLNRADKPLTAATHATDTSRRRFANGNDYSATGL